MYVKCSTGMCILNNKKIISPFNLYILHFVMYICHVYQYVDTYMYYIHVCML
jgi:hypothetical protein